MKLAKHYFARLHTLPDLTYQAWVCDQASAVHKTVCVREALGNALIICCGKQVAIVAQGHFQPADCLFVSTKTGDAPVHICLDPGVDDQLVDGIFLVDGKKVIPILLVMGADPGLDGNLHVQFTKDLVQKGV